MHRDDRGFYQNLIKNSSRRVDVLGVTAQRFMEHFADSSQDSRREARVLLEALSRGVKVRILVPNKKFLRTDSDKTKFESASIVLKQIKSDSQNFNYVYFNHEPAHSIVVIDDECLVGPVLPDVQSKHTPAIYLSNDSPYAKKYLEYFEKEWELASAESAK